MTTTSVENYVILYFSEATAAGTLGPLQRARFATIWEAVDHAHDLRHRKSFMPLEIRDQQDTLITCALMGWRVPHAAHGRASRVTASAA